MCYIPNLTKKNADIRVKQKKKCTRFLNVKNGYLYLKSVKHAF